MDGRPGVEAWNWEEAHGLAKQRTCGFARQCRVLRDAPRRIPQLASSVGSMVRPDRGGGEDVLADWDVGRCAHLLLLTSSLQVGCPLREKDKFPNPGQGASASWGRVRVF